MLYTKNHLVGLVIVLNLIMYVYTATFCILNVVSYFIPLYVQLQLRAQLQSQRRLDT